MNSPFGSAILSESSSQGDTISSCHFASQYASLTIVDPGQYVFLSSVATDYFTITDASNTVIEHGITPLTVSLPTAGTYRLHIAANSTCDTASGCRVTTGTYGNQTVVAQIGFGVTVPSVSLHTPAYRVDATSPQRYNYSLTLYQESELLAAGIIPGTTIKSIGFEKANGGTTPGNNLQMKIWMRAGTFTHPLSFHSWDNCIIGSTLVTDLGNIQFSDADNWVDFTLNEQNYVYTGGNLEIAFENELNGSAPYGTGMWEWLFDFSYGTGYNIGSINSSKPSGMILLSPNSSRGYRPNTRFEIAPPPGTDLKLQELIFPVASCPGSIPLSVVIYNNATDDIDTAIIGWSIDGVAQAPVTWTGKITTGQTAQVGLGVFSSTASTLHNVEVYIQDVGPGVDTVTANDTVVEIFQPALDGSYTINPGLPASATNFQTFTDAVEALNFSGVCGPVTFIVSADSFYEQIILGDVSGTSATNTITFKGAGAENTILSFAQNVEEEKYTWRFDGSAYVTVDSMSIVAESAGFYGWAIHMTDSVNNITIQNCKIAAGEGSTSSYFYGLVASGSNTNHAQSASNIHDVTLDNNHIVGGYTTIIIHGASSSDRAENITITNNVMDDVGILFGIYLRSCLNVIIDNNQINGKNHNPETGVGIVMEGIQHFSITKNHITNFGYIGLSGTGTPSHGPSGGQASNRSVIANNSIGGGFTSSLTLQSAINLSNSSFIDIAFNSIHSDFGSSRSISIGGTGSGIRILNNNVVYSGGGIGVVLYNTNANLIEEINNNNYYTNGSRFAYYNGSFRSDLSALQTVGSPSGNDANSISVNPLYMSNQLLIPLSSALSGAGVGLPNITTDITGSSRVTPPDIGAYEFEPVDNELALIDVHLLDGPCLSANDTIEVRIVNTIGSTINFTIDSVVVTWEVSGPNNSNGTVVFNSGTLPEGDTATAYGLGVDLSEPGNYGFQAYLDTSAVNQSVVNDTLSGLIYERAPVFKVAPSSVTITNDQDSVEVVARSPFMPGGVFFISEISHWRGAQLGVPIGGWPSYLLADDYIEITGFPNSDLGGVTLEVWTSSALNSNYTFPPGTMLSPEGTCIVATAQLQNSQPSPSNYYYHGNGAYTGNYSSTTSLGYILKDGSGNIIDAVGYSGPISYSFPAAANVIPAHWSGSVPNAANTTGIRLEGSYTKNASNWFVCSPTSPQTPNAVNNNVAPPGPGTVSGFSWSMDGVILDTLPDIWVGPFALPGTYYAVATYQTPCGWVSDSVEIIVDFPFCFSPDSLSVNVGCDEAVISWVSGDLMNSTYIEYGPQGFPQGTGTIASGVTSPHTITGLAQGTAYDLYLIDSCAGYVSSVLVHNDTYNTPILSELHESPTTITNSSCAGLLSVNIPLGSVIDSATVAYDMTASGGGATISQQRSYLVCTSPGGNAEPAISAGRPINAQGTESYFRSGLPIANGVVGGGMIDFELHSFSVILGVGCVTTNTVDSNSFTISVYTTDSTFTQLGESAPGFLSFSTLDIVNTQIEAVCDSFTWSVNNRTYTSSGTYVDTLVKANGCDSIMILHLTVEPVDVGVVDSVVSLTALATNAAFQWLDCQNNFSPIAGATSAIFFPAVNGQYAVEVSQYNCVDTSACYVIDRIGVSVFSMSTMRLYPNPTHGTFTLDVGKQHSSCLIRITDINGKVVSEFTANNERTVIHGVEAGAGVYMVQVYVPEGIKVLKLIVL